METRAKISKTLTGRKTGRPARPGFVEATIARNKAGLSPESRKKMADTIRGRTQPRWLVEKIQATDGYKLAQKKLADANEQRKRIFVCVDTGQTFIGIGAVASRSGVSKAHATNNVNHGWRIRGLRYERVKTEL